MQPEVLHLYVQNSSKKNSIIRGPILVLFGHQQHHHHSYELCCFREAIQKSFNEEIVLYSDPLPPLNKEIFVSFLTSLMGSPYGPLIYYCNFKNKNLFNLRRHHCTNQPNYKCPSHLPKIRKSKISLEVSRNQILHFKSG